ncbi:MAG: hypothetical protein WAU78_13150 [Roseiarcus sp.]
MKLKATLIAVAIGCLIASAASAACSTGDVRVKSWNWHVDHGYAIYVGEIVNGCAEASGSYVFKWTAEANRQAKSATLGIIAVNQW